MRIIKGTFYHAVEHTHQHPMFVEDCAEHVTKIVQGIFSPARRHSHYCTANKRGEYPPSQCICRKVATMGELKVEIINGLEETN